MPSISHLADIDLLYISSTTLTNKKRKIIIVVKDNVSKDNAILMNLSSISKDS